MNRLEFSVKCDWATWVNNQSCHIQNPSFLPIRSGVVNFKEEPLTL